jgi:methionyl-tRNA formyltransferase
MRLVFCGTPAESAVTLRALHAAGHDVALVITRADKRRGRGSAVGPSPVRAAAEELGLPVRTPARAREVVDEVRASGAPLGVVVAYGQLLPPALLDALPLGFVNVHFSLLPRWRGAAPVERAILAGDRETGVCIMTLEEALDTGPVHASARTAIGPDETAGELRARLAELGTDLLLEVLPDIGTRQPEPQRGEPTYAEKLSTAEFRIDPEQAAEQLARLVRAGNPSPGAWFTVGGRRVKILRAHAEAAPSGAPGQVSWPGQLITGDGTLLLDEVQVEGKRPMGADAWLTGLRARDVVLDPA